jgi:hypothetical protein
MLDQNESFAVGTSDVHLSNGISQRIVLRLGSALDHEPPQLARVRALTNSLASIQFTEPVFTLRGWDSSISIASESGVRIVPSAYWTLPGTPDVVLMRFAQPIDSAVYTLRLAGGSIVDSAGTPNADTIVTRQLPWTTRRDTTRLQIIRITPADSARDIAVDSSLRIVFSDAVDTNDVRIAVWHQQPQGVVAVDARWLSPVELVIRPKQQRSTKTWYTTTIVPDRLHSFINSTLPSDTITHAMLTTSRTTDPGIVRGSLRGFTPAPLHRSLIMRLLNTQGAVVYTSTVDSSGRFYIESGPAGEYDADVFHDLNGNGRFDHGDWRPFTFSEPWWPIRTKVVIRSRWTLEDVILDVVSR